MKNFLQKPYLYLAIIAIGIGLKFYKLDQKFFWDDEICTMLHTSGIPMDTYEKNIPVNTIVPRSYFDHILALNSRHLTVSDQFVGLLKMPQLTPNHYFYLIFWTRLFGDGYMSYRIFSVVMFLLSLPFLFLFTRKLFNSELTAWIAVSLYAVSPFFQIYAQESRYYILWSLAIMIMHYLFLMASEKQTRQWWVLYTIVGILAIHVTILFSLTFLMHLIHYYIFHKDKLKPFLISLGIITLCALPWLVNVYLNKHAIEHSLSWLTMDVGQSKILNIFKWQLNDFAKVIFNPDIFGFEGLIPLITRIIVVLLLIGTSVLLLLKSNKQQKFFVLLATFTGMVVIVSSDIIRTSFVSAVERYHLLNYIGMILLLAFAATILLKKNQIAFTIVFLMIVTLGITSSKAISDDVSFGNREDSRYHVEDANELFSGNEHILIISDFHLFANGHFAMFMSLIHRAKNKHIDFIYAKPDYPDFAHNFNLEDYDKIYAMYVSDQLIENLKQTFHNELVMIKDRTMYGAFHLPAYQINAKQQVSASQ